ncbi:NUDIX domain-containing protein [Curtobacterium sp. SP.BCo]|uniref:NUDIX domain-containing protein n=1 Tax=Curtobacterium sp. SP.BCo TaxID=3435229 RepID=UPI003F740227
MGRTGAGSTSPAVPEPGESAEQTLRRELAEECGVTVDAIDSWHEFDAHVDRASDGSSIDFRHRGWIACVWVAERVRWIEDVEDVARVVLLIPGSSVSVTPSVRFACTLLDVPRTD